LDRRLAVVKLVEALSGQAGVRNSRAEFDYQASRRPPSPGSVGTSRRYCRCTRLSEPQ